MDLDEVPQDALHYKDRDKTRKKLYATDADGNYTSVNSVGWGPENLALRQAWEEVEQALRDTIARIRNKELSPLAYFMQKNLMDVGLLAKYVNKWQWQVRRHLKHDYFMKLDDELLARYAAVLNTTVEALRTFDPSQAPEA